MKDSDLISRNFYELHYASMELGVPESTVLKALEDLSPNNKREDVYAYIKSNEDLPDRPFLYVKEDEVESILKSAVDTFGEESQCQMLVEECSEVIQAVCKYFRKYRPSNKAEKEYENLCEEIADLEIVISQMKYIFNEDKINAYRDKKLARLKQRIEDYGK